MPRFTSMTDLINTGLMHGNNSSPPLALNDCEQINSGASGWLARNIE
jgi:hypothetical protein